MTTALICNLRRLALCLGLMLVATVASGQDLFAPVVQVGDRIVTQYEVDQRALFLSLLRASGDPEKDAVERLIEEKLQITAAARLGLVVTPEQLLAGEAEFATRANLSRDEFVQALEAGGVDEATFRDFIAAGLLWREVVRGRFGPQVTITEADIDQVLSATAPRAAGVRVLFSEIVLPADTPEARAEAQRRASEIAGITSVEEFSRAARAFSASPSAARGGRLDWIAVSDLAPGLAPVLLALAPGQVTDPLPIPNAIALFQLRAIEDGDVPADLATVDYALYRLPAAADVARIRAEVDNCNDLYEVARSGPPELLERQAVPPLEIPADIAGALAGLDDGEIAGPFTHGSAQVLVMLCSRAAVTGEAVSRDQIRNQLLNQRLTAHADAYLAELRAAAIVRYP